MLFGSSTSLRTHQIRLLFHFVLNWYFRTVNNSKNIGVHYVRHEDTDPELEKPKAGKGSADDEMKSTEESSEDEWTYKNVTANDSMETEVTGNENDAFMSIESFAELQNLSETVLTDVKSESHSDSIQMLVKQVDELVQSPKKKATRQKHPLYSLGAVRHDLQVLEWLHNTHPNDDCYSVSFT